MKTQRISLAQPRATYANSEKFMRDYFAVREADGRREQAAREPFRKKFHTADRRWVYVDAQLAIHGYR